MSVRNGFLIAAAIGLVSAGCASQSARPTGEITRARTLIEQAEKAGAQRFSAAEIDQARVKLRLADAAVEAGKNDEARARANEAAADAELAMARVASGQAKTAAEEVQRSTATLQQEATRGQQQPALPTPNTP